MWSVSHRVTPPRRWVQRASNALGLTAPTDAARWRRWIDRTQVKQLWHSYLQMAPGEMTASGYFRTFASVEPHVSFTPFSLRRDPTGFAFCTQPDLCGHTVREALVDASLTKRNGACGSGENALLFRYSTDDRRSRRQQLWQVSYASLLMSALGLYLQQLLFKVRRVD
jgi:hypothetical protein